MTPRSLMILYRCELDSPWRRFCPCLFFRDVRFEARESAPAARGTSLATDSLDLSIYSLGRRARFCWRPGGRDVPGVFELVSDGQSRGLCTALLGVSA